jgi:superfamily I DNA and/or RNA helicase
MISTQKIENERIDFGIITPYRGQARLLRRLLKMQHYFRKLKRHITVGTVDGFQGQERDVIVISLVRSNAEGQIGFLRDLRRMNVAMTRARMKLIIVGNAETLSRHKFYRALIEHIKQKGDFITPLSRR